MPLSFARTGEYLEIKKINGKDDTKRFLSSLGFNVGEKVSIVSENGGNVILSVKNTRVALDKAMAGRIIV